MGRLRLLSTGIGRPKVTIFATARTASSLGTTIVIARWLLEQEGKITVTLSQIQVEASDLEGVLTPA